MMKKPTKAHLICYVLNVIGCPMTREEILRRVYALCPGKVAFKATSNKSYFAPCKNLGLYSAYSNDKKTSLVFKKLIKVDVNNPGHCLLLYTLTPAGEKLAKEYFSWAQ